MNAQIKLGLVLAAFATASCTVLALVNRGTQSRIEINRITKANNTMKEVMPLADEFTEVKDFSPAADNTISIDSMYLAKKDGTVIGGVVQGTGPTYEKATIMTGVSLDGTVTGTKFLEIKDSPGFGLKASDPGFFLKSGKTFYGQFEGLDAREGFSIDTNIDAISGATITSKGAAAIITEGTASLLKVLENHNSEGDKDEQ